MTFQCPTNRKITDRPSFLDDAKLPAPPPAGAVPVWSPGDIAVATLTPAADGLSAEIVPVAAGSYVYGFSAGTLSYSEVVEFVAPVASTVVSGVTAQPVA
jgi:hypothetical protein